MEIRIPALLKKYISERIPQKATNIFWLMFKGIDEAFQSLEYRLDIFKRERNILTAQHLSSLRNLATQNGFEPVLKIPAKGLLKINISPKLFSRVGYPLFIPPYANFTDRITKNNFYFNSNTTLRIDTNSVVIPVVEGLVQSTSFVSEGKFIERFYILDSNIADGSIVVESNGVVFQEVKNFFNNSNINDNKQFVVKFSSNIQKPIVIYIKGLSKNDNVVVSYKLTVGSQGNISNKHGFETTDIIDNRGNEVLIDDSEIEIFNISGFDFGSDGTDENSLRSSIGFNHGINLLFDEISYRNFINKYSTLMTQKIVSNIDTPSIKNIYIWKKQSVNPNYIPLNYQQIALTESYKLTNQEKTNLDNLLSENEFTLNSHNLFDAEICKFAIQLKFDSIKELELNKVKLENLIYGEFAKFFHVKNHIFNAEILFDNYRKENKVNFDYIVFNQKDEEEKINQNSDIVTSYIINSEKYLPILKGDFEIIDSFSNKVKLFFDINMVV